MTYMSKSIYIMPIWVSKVPLGPLQSNLQLQNCQKFALYILEFPLCFQCALGLMKIITKSNKILVEEKMTSKILRKFQKIQRKSDHNLLFRFTIIKWTFDNFGAAGLIVEVLTELLTPILTYGIFVICHLWYVIYEINVKYVIYLW